jgi:hypothetical protein
MGKTPLTMILFRFVVMRLGVVLVLVRVCRDMLVRQRMKREMQRRQHSRAAEKDRNRDRRQMTQRMHRNPYRLPLPLHRVEPVGAKGLTRDVR